MNGTSKVLHKSQEGVHAFWLVALVVAAITLNNLFMERHIRAVLARHPELISDALTRVQQQRTSEAALKIQEALAKNWDALSAIRAYAVRFDGSQFTSRLVRLAEVATPRDLNLVATDYRCGYCKGDRPAIDALLRANPNKVFVFMEAPLLGPESSQLATEALRRAQRAQGDYYVIHNQQFDAALVAADKSSSDPPDAAVELLTEQKRFLETVGIVATPTYVRAGMVRYGAIDDSNRLNLR